MESVLAIQPSTLDTLPTDILYVILGLLDTARSVANLSATCKGLNHVISTSGWRIFVRKRFNTLTLPEIGFESDWVELARILTVQSRDWDRRAFVINYLTPPRQTRLSYVQRGRVNQSIPNSIIVDASLQRRGRFDEELVVCGAGEDVWARIRRKDHTSVVSENWYCSQGSESGFVAGKDDTTAISIAKAQSSGEIEDLGVVVGRANGDLRLLSLGDSSFGHTLMQFRPSPSSSLQQREIQAIDIDNDSGMIAVGTREDFLLYPIQGRSQIQHNLVNSTCTDPVTAVSLRTMPECSAFGFIRSVKTLKKDTFAVALNRSFDPIHVIHATPTGLSLSKPALISSEHSHLGSIPPTIRALLPVDLRSIASGCGNTLLSSWDDGTIRLQDLRSPSLVSRVYQDNFDVSTPINSLISYGLERFVAGSGHTAVLKVFDFRWPKGYYHTDSLPCANHRPYPIPKPPTIVNEPKYHDNQPMCNHVLGRLCRWHSLSRDDFYRPNCIIWPGHSRDASPSPVYSLAKPSDISPSIYAGLSQRLVEFSLKSGMLNSPELNSKSLFMRQTSEGAILETGDGLAVSDVSKCQRVPEIRRQSLVNNEHANAAARRQHRLDEALQYRRDLEVFI
ncbi:hypothetical protein GGS21DRAFT_527975 [Xylaria nigripes]|nr:hypothetical protein GGS21DRAFT_527975 [Xylaria nigripes]